MPLPTAPNLVPGNPPKLQDPTAPIVDKDGRPSVEFVQYLQRRERWEAQVMAWIKAANS